MKKTNQNQNTKLPQTRHNRAAFALCLLAFLLLTACAPTGAQALSPTLTRTPSATLPAPWSGTVGAAGAQAQSTIQAGQAQLSVLEVTGTAGAQAAQLTEAHIGQQLTQAAHTEAAISRATQAAATYTAGALQAQLTGGAATAQAVQARGTAQAVAAESAATNTQRAAVAAATQAELTNRTALQERRAAMRRLLTPIYYLLGLAAVVGLMLALAAFLWRALPGFAIKVAGLVRGRGGKIFLILGSPKRTVIVDPDHILTPALGVGDIEARHTAEPETEAARLLAADVKGRDQLITLADTVKHPLGGTDTEVVGDAVRRDWPGRDQLELTSPDQVGPELATFEPLLLEDDNE